MSSDFVLDDNAKIAVIGGGPSGTFFSYFALKMARMIDRKIEVTIFEPKAFTKDGPIGCNRCGRACLAGITVPEVIASVRSGVTP